jgi:hypothetical protein
VAVDVASPQYGYGPVDSPSRSAYIVDGGELTLAKGIFPDMIAATATEAS